MNSDAKAQLGEKVRMTKRDLRMIEAASKSAAEFMRDFGKGKSPRKWGEN